jgi:hypothetical protein
LSYHAIGTAILGLVAKSFAADSLTTAELMVLTLPLAATRAAAGVIAEAPLVCQVLRLTIPPPLLLRDAERQNGVCLKEKSVFELWHFYLSGLNKRRKLH